MEFQKSRNHTNVSVSVKFDGGLQSTVRGQLVSELTKYFLYERQQIPMPIDHVKREIKEKVK